MLGAGAHCLLEEQGLHILGEQSPAGPFRFSEEINAPAHSFVPLQKWRKGKGKDPADARGGSLEQMREF